MELPKYELKAGDSRMIFEFVSVGSKGNIHKLVRFTSTIYTNIYNLAFGERIPGTNEIDDQSISNNGDTEKVLSTVASAVYSFTETQTETWVYATGSTSARTRLYQMCINKYFDEIYKYFDVLGLINDNWQPFEKGKNYDAFLVKRKEVNLLYENKKSS